MSKKHRKRNIKMEYSDHFDAIPPEPYVYIDFMDERFIYIDGKKTKYTVTRDGKVYSYNNNKRTELKQYTDIHGYVSVRLQFKKRQYGPRVHRLVAKRFIQLPVRYVEKGFDTSQLTVNHINGKYDIDGNPLNFVENLEWTTLDENLDHALETGLNKVCYGSDNPLTKNTEEQIHEVCRLLEEAKLSIDEITQHVGLSSRDVIDSIRNYVCWTDISSQYKISNYDINKARGINNHLCTTDEQTVHEICRLLEEGKLSIGKIAQATGVSKQKVKHIKHHRTWNHISCLYNF